MITERLSAGLYQSERDISYLPKTPGAVGAVVIGPTEMGEAFIPTIISSISDFNLKFGFSNSNTYVPQTVYNYMKYGDTMTVVRIMSESGYKHEKATAISMTTQDDEQSIIAVLHHAKGSTSVLGDTAKITLTIDPDLYSNNVFTANISVTDDITTLTETYEFSLISTDANYIGKVFSGTPNTSKLVYLYNLYDEKIDELINYTIIHSTTYTLNEYSFDLNFDGTSYQNAITPWITSQYINSLNDFERLFRFKTFSHGVIMNKKIKVCIENIKFATEVPNSNYGKFDVVIRDFTDTDNKPIVLERYQGITLDPNDSNYICKVIGDEYRVVINGKIIKNGNYTNISNYVYVEVNDTIANGSMPTQMVPFGFERLNVPFIESSISKSFPTTSYITGQITNNIYDSKVYHGYNFSSTDNLQYLCPIAISHGTNILNNKNITFNLADCTLPIDAPQDGGDSVALSTLLSARKFILPFQNGFDGEDPALYKAIGSDITSTNVYGYDFSTSVTNGTLLYKKAFLLLSNKDVYNFNLLMTPGLIYRLHTPIITSGINLCEGRGDVLYIFDSSCIDDTVDTVSNITSTLDTNYAATYYPWGKLLDTDMNKFVWVPPSVFVPRAISFNDKIGYAWSAPAGLNRAILDNILDVRIQLDESERDTLYSNKVNPIATFQEGITVWGQKTLQQKSSALDRINVRRLLISMKKYTDSKIKYVVFEQNTVLTRNTIINILTPYMDNIKQRGGLYDFKIIVNEQTNTNEVIDRNQLNGIIYIKPTKTAEFINLEWTITGTSFDFNTI